MQSTHCWTSPQLVVLLREVMEPLGVRVFLEKVSHRGGGGQILRFSYFYLLFASCYTNIKVGMESWLYTPLLPGKALHAMTFTLSQSIPPSNRKLPPKTPFLPWLLL